MNKKPTPKVPVRITQQDIDEALYPINVRALSLAQALRIYKELQEVFK